MTMIFANHEPWVDQAACVKRTILEVSEIAEYFYPDRGVNPVDAREFCVHCPVVEQCGRYGMEHDEPGVWGGLTQEQRRRLAKSGGPWPIADCDGCGGRYFPRGFRSRFCADCSPRRLPVAAAKACEHCGTTFPADRTDRKFCSRECVARAKSETRPCAICGTEFTAPPARRRKYCSIQCAGKAKRGVHVIKTTCGECGVVFEHPPAHPRKFCSQSCSGKFNNRARPETEE